MRKTRPVRDLFSPDPLDVKILALLLKDATLQHTQISTNLGVDKRTVAKRLNRMVKSGLIRTTVDVDWSLLGVGVSAYLGTTTALGEEDVAKLYDFIKRDPRILEAYSTVGSNEYFLRVFDLDLQTLREGVLRKLEPLTADLSTSIISSAIKPKDFSPFLDYLREHFAW